MQTKLLTAINSNDDASLSNILLTNPELAYEFLPRPNVGKTPLQVAAKLLHWKCVLAFVVNKDVDYIKARVGTGLLAAAKANATDIVLALCAELQTKKIPECQNYIVHQTVILQCTGQLSMIILIWQLPYSRYFYFNTQI